MKNLYKNYWFILSIVILQIVACNKDDEPTFPEPKPCTGTPEVHYGGLIYHTVQIGEQCWLTKSLNIGTMIANDVDATNNGIIEKHCYNNDTANCFIYGGLYQWDELMQYTESEGARGLCPEGWHIPTNKELGKLIVHVGGHGTYLRPFYNSTGMNLLNSGVMNKSEGSVYLSALGYYWTSKEISENESQHFHIGISYSHDDISTGPIHKKIKCSVRCIKNTDK